MVSAKQKANWARFAKMARAKANKGGKAVSKKGKRRSTKARGAPHKDRATPAGATLGVIGTGVELLTEKMPDGSISVLDAVFYPYPTIGAKVSALGFKSRIKLKQIDNYKLAAAGALVSASPKIPGVRMIAAPIDRAVRRVFKGKVSL